MVMPSGDAQIKVVTGLVDQIQGFKLSKNSWSSIGAR